MQNQLWLVHFEHDVRLDTLEAAFLLFRGETSTYVFYFVPYIFLAACPFDVKRCIVPFLSCPTFRYAGLKAATSNI
jgi:hypothetical protein